MRDGDGRFGFSEDQPYRQTARRRTPPPPRARTNSDNYAARQAMRTELFPSKKNKAALSNDQSSNGGAVELFPDRKSSTVEGKELFPDKVAASHRRQEAKDLHPDEVATAIGKCTLNRLKESSTYGSSGRRPENTSARHDRTSTSQRDAAPPRDLFARIDANSTAGRLNERASSSQGFSIKGRSEESGISILGASRERTELFPRAGKAGGGTDLFEDKIRSRRRGAEHFI